MEIFCYWKIWVSTLLKFVLFLKIYFSKLNCLISYGAVIVVIWFSVKQSSRAGVLMQLAHLSGHLQVLTAVLASMCLIQLPALCLGSSRSSFKRFVSATHVRDPGLGLGRTWQVWLFEGVSQQMDVSLSCSLFLFLFLSAWLSNK